MLLLLTLVPLALVGFIVNEIDDDDDNNSSSEDGARINGTDDGEIIDATSGNDTVFAGGEGDLVLANDGNDRVFGQDGPDDIIGGEGDDFLRGGAGNDVITADAGNDTLFGDAGNDVLDGTDFADNEGIVRAALASDTPLTDEELAAFIDFDNETGEADTLNGGVGNDDIIAGSNDVVSTGDGADFVVSGDWVIPGEPITVTDFDPSEDVMVYSYLGDTAPNVFFGENDDGVATLEIAVSDTENQVIAELQGVDFTTLNNSTNLQILQAA